MPPRGKGAAAPYFGPVSRPLPRPFHGACRMCRCIFRCRERKRPQRPEYCRKLLSLQRFPEGGAQPGLSPGAPIFLLLTQQIQDEKHPNQADSLLQALEPQGLGSLCEPAPPCNHRSPRRDDVDPLARDATCVCARCRYGRRPQNAEDRRGRHFGQPVCPDAQRTVANPAFRPESTGRSARPDPGVRPAPRTFGRYPRTRGQGHAGRHLHPWGLFRPDHGTSQWHRLHRCPHRAPVPCAARRHRLHFGRRPVGRRAGRRGLCRGGEYPHGAPETHLPALRGRRRPARLRLCEPFGRCDFGPFLAARRRFLPSQRRPQYRFRQLQRFRACDLRGSPRRVLRPAGRLPEPHVRFQRLLCGL